MYAFIQRVYIYIHGKYYKMVLKKKKGYHISLDYTNHLWKIRFFLYNLFFDILDLNLISGIRLIIS